MTVEIFLNFTAISLVSRWVQNLGCVECFAGLIYYVDCMSGFIF